MPSPTATIRPTSADTRLASKSLSRSLMTSEISLVLIPTRFLLLSAPRLRGRQAAAQLLQPGGHTRVDDPVSVLKLQPADDARIDDDAQPALFVQTFRQLADFGQAPGPFFELTILLGQLEHGPRVPSGSAARARHRIFGPQSLGAVTSHPACGCRRHSRPPRWPARSALGACDRQACRR